MDCEIPAGDFAWYYNLLTDAADRINEYSVAPVPYTDCAPRGVSTETCFPLVFP